MTKLEEGEEISAHGVQITMPAGNCPKIGYLIENLTEERKGRVREMADDRVALGIRPSPTAQPRPSGHS